MRGPVWKKAVKQHVLPLLPGAWLVQDTLLIQQPVEHLVHAIGRANVHGGPPWKAWANIRPLYLAQDHWDAMLSLETVERVRWPNFPSFDSPEEGSDTMRQLIEHIQADALPYFLRYGTPEGYLKLCKQQNTKYPRGAHHSITRAQAATELLLGDAKAALNSIEQVIRLMTTGSHARWMDDIAAEAEDFRDQVRKDPDGARETLHEIEAQERAKLKLPPAQG